MANASSKDFDIFVKQQQALADAKAKASTQEIDWGKRRDDWVASLNSLYGEIEDYLKDYTAAKMISIEKEKMIRHEEHIGEYVVDKMKITIGGKTISLIPLGTTIIGAKGRVDVEGSAGKARIIYVDKLATSPGLKIKIKIMDTAQAIQPTNEGDAAAGWAWKIVGSPPSVSYIDLNKESFMQLLMEISNA